METLANADVVELSEDELMKVDGGFSLTGYVVGKFIDLAIAGMVDAINNPDKYRADSHEGISTDTGKSL